MQNSGRKQTYLVCKKNIQKCNEEGMGENLDNDFFL